METYLRLMFREFRHGLGTSRCAGEVSDSITWRRFCRIPMVGTVPHQTTLVKLTTRCGTAAIDGLNEALLAKAVEAKVLRTKRLCADTIVAPASVAYPIHSGLLAMAITRIAVTGRGSGPRVVRCAPGCGIVPVPPEIDLMCIGCEGRSS
jgi:IS5 family transposase